MTITDILLMDILNMMQEQLIKGFLQVPLMVIVGTLQYQKLIITTNTPSTPPIQQEGHHPPAFHRVHH